MAINNNKNFAVAPSQSGYSSTEIWIELEFGNVGFWGDGKSGVPGEKSLGAEKRPNNKLNPYIASSLRIDPQPHWCEASALTTVPSLLPIISWIANFPGESAIHTLNKLWQGLSVIRSIPTFKSITKVSHNALAQDFQ